MDQALTYTRTLMAQLSPPIQNEFGLPMALKWLAEQMKHRDFAVSLELEGNSLPLPEDQARLLYQSARELIINVMKHGQTDHATVGVTVAKGVLRLVVTDQGAGFDLAAAAAKTDHVPHFGLFSIRERMKALGGDFELRSRPGEGTQATLVLPLTPKTPQAANHELGMKSEELGMKSDNSTFHISHSSWHQSGKIRVLLVDDHAMVRQGLKSILEVYQDISVVGEAADGEEAVELARALSPDVVVMDVNMPKMDGIEAVRRIKAQQPATWIVGLSLSQAGQVEPRLLQAGASHFVSKDLAADRLYEAIIAVVRHVSGSAES
jgi:CheY-like chemotaxis protein/anti-sigma regulatory factor (Ser/Thr protein kinase)